MGPSYSYFSYQRTRGWRDAMQSHTRRAKQVAAYGRRPETASGRCPYAAGLATMLAHSACQSKRHKGSGMGERGIHPLDHHLHHACVCWNVSQLSERRVRADWRRYRMGNCFKLMGLITSWLPRRPHQTCMRGSSRLLIIPSK